jgi:hypothetical protein
MTLSEIVLLIKKYLPTFVEDKEVLNSILVSIAKELKKFFDEAGVLPNAPFIGKGLQLTSDENGIFYDKKSINDVELSTKLSAVEDILKKRGSEYGIQRDLEHLIAGNWVLTFLNINQVGIIIDNTYYTDKYYAPDVIKIIELENDSGGTAIEFTEYEMKKIMREILPIDVIMETHI